MPRPVLGTEAGPLPRSRLSHCPTGHRQCGSANACRKKSPSPQRLGENPAGFWGSGPPAQRRPLWIRYKWPHVDSHHRCNRDSRSGSVAAPPVAPGAVGCTWRPGGSICRRGNRQPWRADGNGSRERCRSHHPVEGAGHQRPNAHIAQGQAPAGVAVAVSSGRRSTKLRCHHVRHRRSLCHLVNSCGLRRCDPRGRGWHRWTHHVGAHPACGPIGNAGGSARSTPRRGR